MDNVMKYIQTVKIVNWKMCVPEFTVERAKTRVEFQRLVRMNGYLYSPHSFHCITPTSSRVREPMR
jgi:hypothetical protein